MKAEFDPKKSAVNAERRGLPFELAAELDWTSAVTFADERKDYGEKRMIALVPMQRRLFVVCYVMRGEVRRIISFRKANRREVEVYDQAALDR